jgi:hypothetical protein
MTPAATTSATTDGATGDGGGAAAAVQWDPFLVALVEAAVAKGSNASAWATFQGELQARPLTLVSCRMNLPGCGNKEVP